MNSSSLDIAAGGGDELLDIGCIDDAPPGQYFDQTRDDVEHKGQVFQTQDSLLSSGTLSNLSPSGSPDTIAKMRAASIGKKRSPETIAKMRAAQLGKARAHGLLDGAEESYGLARRHRFGMDEAIRIANRDLRRRTDDCQSGGGTA